MVGKATVSCLIVQCCGLLLIADRPKTQNAPTIHSIGEDGCKELGIVADTREELRNALVVLTASIANPASLQKNAIAEVVDTLLAGVPSK